MALVLLFKNQFSQECEEIQIQSGIKLCDVLKEINLPQQEIYNQKTNKTKLKTIKFEDAIVFVNGVKQPAQYTLQKEDVITIYLRQFGGGGGGDGFWNFLGKIASAAAFAGAFVLGVAFMPVSAFLGTGLFLTGFIGTVIGVKESVEAYQEWKSDKTQTIKDGETTEKLLSLRGGKNQSIIGQRVPFIIGRHLINPLVVGAPYTEISSKDGIGDVITQKQLMIVGYQPLEITDVKFEENIVAYNRETNINGNSITRPTVFHGKLKGYGSDEDNGDIVKKWKNNDIEIEILQGNGNETDKDLYGTIYPQTVKTTEVNANVLHLYDKDLESTAKVVYKNVAFNGGFRTNTVQFSASCPSRLEVELDLPNGLFGTDTYTTDSVSEPRYYKIPCNIAVQWRFVNITQESSTAEDPTGWKSFTHGSDCSLVNYTSDLAQKDISYNKGLSSGTSSEYNQKWIDAKCFTLGAYDGTSYTKGNVNINQRRYVFSYDFSLEEARILSEDNEFLDVVEVRVVRLTPMFLDQQGSISSDSNYTNRSFQDLTKWSVLRTYCFDKEDFLKKQEEISALTEVPLRPLTRDDMSKFCIVAISAKPDKAGSLSNAFEKINLIATSLSPNYVNETWVPEVKKKQNFYEKIKTDTDVSLEEITEEEYFSKIKTGKDVFKVNSGNSFNQNIKAEICTSQNLFLNDINGYYLTKDIRDKYASSNPASGFLLALFGGALGNEAKDYTDVNMPTVTELYNFCEDVVDGRPDASSPDMLKHIKYSCNGIVFSEQKLGTLLTQILFTGRSVVNFDDNGKLKVVIDKPKKYPEMILSQQNCISGMNTKTLFSDPSGFSIDFTDEDDNYTQNVLYIMADGEDYKSPKKEIVSYKIPFVTNRDHLWSIGRYLLGTQRLQKEVYNRVVGKIGRLLKCGSYVLLKDETLSVGTDKGGRIQFLIEDEQYVYGFVIDDVYEYTGELEDGLCKKGFILVQPQETGNSRCVTLRMCTPEGITTQSGEVLTPTIGQTNVVILETPILKAQSESLIDGQWVTICPKEGNLVEFGNVGNITQEAIVTSVKPNENGTFSISLCQYTPDIYNYGRKLPTLQNARTTIQPQVGEFEFIDFVDKSQVQEETANNINGLLVQQPQAKKPDKPDVLKILATKDGIAFSINIPNKKENAVQAVEWELDTGNGFSFFYKTTEENGFYKFNKEYFEASDFNSWKFRARIVNVYNNYSEYSDPESVDVSSYGTWKIGKPLIFSQVMDRTALLSFTITSRSDNKEVYGNIKYKLVIRRIGNKDIVGTEDYVEPDTVWYKPSTQTSPFESEENYRQGNSVDVRNGLEVYSSYSQTLPLVGQTNNNSVATEYQYKVIAYNEAGFSVESDVMSISALPTNIADIVHSNENYKDLYVQRLSAISANVGLISQGGFGSFKNAENYWALSNLSAEETGIQGGVKKGAFRVGGTDQYIWVEPVIENGIVIDYSVSVKAGNFIITSLGTQINGELIVQKNDKSDERTRITPSGTYFERKVGSDWQIINRFDTSGVLSPSYRADKQVLIGNFSQQQQRMLNHDIGRAYLSSNGRVWHFDENYYSNYGTLDGLEISGEYNLYGTNDSSGIDYTPAIKAVAPYCQIARCIAGNFSIKKTLSTKTATVDFWLQYLYAENQQLFSVGTIDDSIDLVIAGDEPVFCTSGVVTWNNSGETVYTTSRNPSVGDFVYATVNNAETSTSPIGEIVSKVVDENYLTTKITTLEKDYSFKSGDADFNWEIFADESAWVNSSVLANMAVSKDMFLNVNHQGEKQSYLLNELFNSDEQVFKHGQWYHLALIFGTDNLTFVIDKEYRNFVRTGTTTSSFDIVLNTNKNKVIIDELYIDTAVESVSDFIKNTDEKIPWASLDSGKNWFVFDAEDTSLVKSNILDNFEQKIIDKTVHTQEISMTGLGFANNEVVAPIDLWKVLYQRFGPSGQLYISWSNANAAYIGSETNKISLNGGLFSYSCGSPWSTWKVFSGMFVDRVGAAYTIGCQISGDTSSNTWNIKTL